MTVRLFLTVVATIAAAASAVGAWLGDLLTMLLGYGLAVGLITVAMFGPAAAWRGVLRFVDRVRR